MKSAIVRTLLAGLVSMLSVSAMAQASCENPLEYAALTEGNILINEVLDDEIRGQTETAVLQNAIALEFNKIREWEKKYSQYTQTVEGFASSLNAASHIYEDAMHIMVTLGKLGSTISDNPQGVVATMSMNTLYVETATELVSCFTLIRDAVAKGGKQNMLTGAERSQMLWNINDKMDAFAKKLRLLYLSIRYYRMIDVWNTYTAGMIERANGDIAHTAHERWIRAAQTME